jgi:hypothetical protein
MGRQQGEFTVTEIGDTPLRCTSAAASEATSISPAPMPSTTWLPLTNDDCVRSRHVQNRNSMIAGDQQQSPR